MSSPGDRAAYLALCGATVAVAFPKYSTVPLGPVAAQLSDLCILVATLCAVPQLVRLRTRLLLPLGLYLAGLALSFVHAPHLRTTALKGVGILSLMAALLVTLAVVRTPERWKRLADVWIATASAAALAGLVGVAAYALGLRDNPMIGNHGSIPHLAVPRIEGTFLNSNMLASYLVVTLCLLVARHRELGRWRAVPWLLVGGLLPFTMSPELGAAAVAVAVVLVVARPALPLRGAFAAVAAAAAVAMAVLALVVMVPPGQGDVSLGPIDLKVAESGRIVGWRSALETWWTHPLTGVGAGEPVARFTHEYAAQGSFHHPMTFTLEAHNAFIGLLAQMGPLALAGFAWLLAALIARARSVGDLWVRAGLLAALLGPMFYGNLFGGFEDARHAWLLFGLVASHAFPST